tara:strand:+ start:633 stop:914 length:282 start_codon:yes stop_codon:yes gene_type:complete
MYMLFKPDGSLKITINTLTGVEKMISDENLTTKEYEYKDFRPEQYVYSLNSGNVVSSSYTLTPPPEVEIDEEPTVSELLKRIEILESQVSGSN